MDIVLCRCVPHLLTLSWVKTLQRTQTLLFLFVTSIYAQCGLQINLRCIFFSEVKGMATVGHMMSQITKNRAVITDPVSKVIYTQFKQVPS